jgi:hypothetical protein
MFEQHLYPPSAGRTILAWDKSADGFASLSYKATPAVALAAYFLPVDINLSA